MKVIHVAGWSGSGKTTFILDLVSKLSALGPVGTIKHIGDHICDQPAGKDTTRHYDAGAVITAGIDLEKTMVTARSLSLATALDMLCNAGVRYAVVEGFKKVRFQKIAFGDIDVPALAKNPTTHEVISLLSQFDDYYTLTGLVRDLYQIGPDGVIMTMTGPADASFREQAILIETNVSLMDGVLGVKVRVNPLVFSEKSDYFVVIRAHTPPAGLAALGRITWQETPFVSGEYLPEGNQ